MKPYQRGDVVVIDVPMLTNSHIQAGKRPWVVVQNNVGNQFSPTSIVVPLRIHRYVSARNRCVHGGTKTLRTAPP